MYNIKGNVSLQVRNLFSIITIFCFTTCSTPAQKTDRSTIQYKDRNTAIQDTALYRSYTKPSQIRSLKQKPNLLNLTTNGQTNVFQLDPKDNTTPDNGRTVIVTNYGNRYKIILNGPINAQYHFGAKGDGTTDDTQALQAAINAACNANNPAARGTASPANISNTVYIPHGSYKVTGELVIRGSCTIMMEQATSYGGTRIQQVTAGKHLFHIVKDNDGQSSGVHLIGGILKGSASTVHEGIALIYGGEGNNDANNNSTYLDNVWFQTPEQYGIHIARGDDINIRNCTFDVSAYHAVKLGSQTNVVTNSSIIGCTFYNIKAGAIDLINIDGLLVNNNRVYSNEKQYIPYFINTNGKNIKGLQINNNYLDYVNRMIFINHNAEDIQITNNMHRHGFGRSIELGGGQVITTVYITNNVITGDFSGKVKIGPEVPDSPVFGFSTGLHFSKITGNTFRHIGKNKAVTPMLLTDKRVSNNIINGNMAIGFSDNGQIANSEQNQVK